MLGLISTTAQILRTLQKYQLKAQIIGSGETCIQRTLRNEGKRDGTH